jgi:hypothetical protein
VLHIVSLLGHKRDGFSEFAFYPFRSSAECNEKVPFEAWLHARYGRRFVVHEFPTIDAQGIPAPILEAVRHCVLACLENGNTTIVIDSAGKERTARLCEALGFKATTPLPPRPTEPINLRRWEPSS